MNISQMEYLAGTVEVLTKEIAMQKEQVTELLVAVTTFVMGWDFEYVSEACQSEADQLLDAVQKFIDRE